MTRILCLLTALGLALAPAGTAQSAAQPASAEREPAITPTVQRSATARGPEGELFVVWPKPHTKESARTEATIEARSAPVPCSADDDTLCLHNERFELEVDWRDFAGHTGSGRVVPAGSSESGLFWFFAPDNWEMLVKVLDGCTVNDRYWVFAAASTNVEYTLRVTDRESGCSKDYFNPLGQAAPAITDTAAFATCPPPRPQLLLFANPSTLSIFESTTITIVARDEDGESLGAGERIRLFADLGQVANEVVTDENSEATAVFTAGDRAGTGSVTAILGSGETGVVELTILDAAATIALIANPNTVPHFGTSEDIALLARVSNPRGEPLSGVLVSFDTEAGTLTSGDGGVVTTSLGEARATLRVSDEDLAAFPPGGTFRVFASVVGSGQTLTAEVRILVL